MPDPDFDTSTLDKPGLILLGERQEQFLKEWANDWRGHKLKAVLSQTVFANVATHHGGFDGYLKADLDSGGWPQYLAGRYDAAALRARLAAHVAKQQGCEPGAIVFQAGLVRGPGGTQTWEQVVDDAYHARVQLWSDGFYATPGLSWDGRAMQGRPFYYFAYGAAVSEVVVDTLTGEWKLLRADLLHDAGRSLNPALDIGQVEGAYIQGMGWLTLEELVWHPQTGALMTHAPSTYKIPTANDAPAVFRTALFDAPAGVDSIHRSKAVGEPPLLLGFSAFFAIRDAVAAAGRPGADVPLDAPATPEAILRAVQAVQAA